MIMKKTIYIMIIGAVVLGIATNVSADRIKDVADPKIIDEVERSEIDILIEPVAYDDKELVIAPSPIEDELIIAPNTVTKDEPETGDLIDTESGENAFSDAEMLDQVNNNEIPIPILIAMSAVVILVIGLAIYKRK